MGNKIDKDIGVRIAKLRESHNLSQSQLADELGKIGLKVRRESITQWENGTRDLKTDYTIKLAEFFGVTCDYILRAVEADNVSIAKATGLNNAAIEKIRMTSKLLIPYNKHFTLGDVQNKVIALGYMSIMVSFFDYLDKAYDLNECKKKIVELLKSYHEQIPENLENKIAEWAIDCESSLHYEAVNFFDANNELNFSLFKLQENVKNIAEQLKREIDNG